MTSTASARSSTSSSDRHPSRRSGTIPPEPADHLEALAAEDRGRSSTIALQRKVDDTRALDELLNEEGADAELERELASSVDALEQDLEKLELAALLSGEYDVGRRDRHDQRGRRRHGVPGLGRDAAAHVHAVGRAARVRPGPG